MRPQAIELLPEEKTEKNDIYLAEMLAKELAD
jgi:hypothetical protein